MSARVRRRLDGSKHHCLTQYSLAFDFRQKHFLPILGAMHVARSQLRTQTVSLPVEQQQRVIAGRFKMAVVGTVFLFSIDRNFRTLDVRCSKLAGNKRKSSVFRNAFQEPIPQRRRRIEPRQKEIVIRSKQAFRDCDDCKCRSRVDSQPYRDLQNRLGSCSL
jgi:hypothetical protein